MMTEELKIALEQQARVQLEVLRLRLEAFKVGIAPALKSSIGKTFALREESRDWPGGLRRWATFRRLLSVEAKLEICKEYATDDTIPLPMLKKGWKECTPEEYTAQREATLKEIADPVRLLKKLRGEDSAV
jgi:hypothetical protein